MEDRGNSVLPKSNAEDMEYDRPDLACPDSGSSCECYPRGSWSSSESLREDEIPEGEEEREDLAAESEEAREASSRESRGALPSREKAVWDIV